MDARPRAGSMNRVHCLQRATRSVRLRLRFIQLALTLVAILIPCLAFSQDFTAKSLGDHGNVTVMEVNGNYDVDNPDGSVNAITRQAIAKEFFKTHKDEYDYLVIFTNFDFTMPPRKKARSEVFTKE